MPKRTTRWKHFQDSQQYLKAMAKLYQKPFNVCVGEDFDKKCYPGTKKKIVA